MNITWKGSPNFDDSTFRKSVKYVLTNISSSLGISYWFSAKPRFMNSIMLGNSYSYKIFWTIIQSISVNVMGTFKRFKFSSKFFLKNKYVDKLPSFIISFVSPIIDSKTAFITRFLVTTKTLFISETSQLFTTFAKGQTISPSTSPMSTIFSFKKSFVHKIIIPQTRGIVK